MTYDRIEDIPYDLLWAGGGTFQVKAKNVHRDLRKRRGGAVAVLTQDQWAGQGTVGTMMADGDGPTPQGPWMFLVYALFVILVSVCICVVSTTVTSNVVTMTSDPVDVIAWDSEGRPTLLRNRRSGRVMTVGYDDESSAYIEDVVDPAPWIPGLTPDIMLYVILGLAIMVVIVLVLFRTPITKMAPEKAPPKMAPEKAPEGAPPKKEEAPKEGEKPKGNDQFERM